jgi:hypothetical protein
MTIKIEKGTGERDKQTGKQRKGHTVKYCGQDPGDKKGNYVAVHKAN